MLKKASAGSFQDHRLKRHLGIYEQDGNHYTGDKRYNEI
jgi:hypothetical protein